MLTQPADKRFVRDGYGAVFMHPDTWYVAVVDCDKRWDKYSKGWHKIHGAVHKYSNRRVCLATSNNGKLPSPQGMIVTVVSAQVTLVKELKKYDRWPPAGKNLGMLKACIDCIPFDDLLLLINHTVAEVRELVAARYRKGN